MCSTISANRLSTLQLARYSNIRLSACARCSASWRSLLACDSRGSHLSEAVRQSLRAGVEIPQHRRPDRVQQRATDGRRVIVVGQAEQRILIAR